MTAVGIHEHPVKKLGARTGALRSNTPVIKFAAHLKAVPTHPISDAQPDYDYPMDRNDEVGDCVVAGADHALELINKLLGKPYTNWSDAQLLSYYQTQNPGFKNWSYAGTNADQGMDIQEFLSYLVKKGVILGFASVDVDNEEELKAATYLGLAIVTGEDLQVANQNGYVWDYVKGSGSWGGHCTVWSGYAGSPDNFNTVSWGSNEYEMTANFVKNRVSEAYFIITQAQVDNPAFRAGFDLNSFGQAYTALTGKTFNYKPTPAPGPNPEPTPTPEPTPAPSSSPFLVRFLQWLKKLLGL